MLSDNIPSISGTSRDEDKKTIIEELIKCTHPGVSIVGIDGLGNTSLARTILSDEAIKSHFPLILSASVSGGFQMAEVVHRLVANHSETCTCPQTAESHQVDVKLLQHHLHKERALIVLDDVWSVVDQDWQSFKSNYFNMCSGWKVLITTSNPKVAEVTESIAHYLDSMSYQDCTNLIREKGNLSELDCFLELSKKHSEHEMEKEALRPIRISSLSWNSNELKLQNHQFDKDDFLQLRDAEGFIKLRTRSLSTIIFQKLQNLRLLVLSHTHISIALSKYLQQLDLSYTEVDELPKQIQHLYFFRSLQLKSCSKLYWLSEEPNEFISLRHLYTGGKKLGCLPPKRGKLRNLEVRDSFSVGKDGGYKVEEPRNAKSLTKIPFFGLAKTSLLTKRCQDGEADQAMVGCIPYLEADETEVVNKMSSQPLASDKDQAQVPINENQLPTFDNLVKKNNVSQGVGHGVPSSRSNSKLWLPWLTSQNQRSTVSEQSSRKLAYPRRSFLCLLLQCLSLLCLSLVNFWLHYYDKNHARKLAYPWRPLLLCLLFACLAFVCSMNNACMDLRLAYYEINPGATPLSKWVEFWTCTVFGSLVYLWATVLYGTTPVPKWEFWTCMVFGFLYYIRWRTVHYGLWSQVRDGMKRLHEGCWHGIQMLGDKAHGRLSHAKGILFLFGESYEFEKDKLIQLWMAGGSIKNEPMEENGANYFKKLVSEGYILPCDSNSLYKVKWEKLNSELEMVRNKSSFLRLESASQSNVVSAETLHIAVVGDEINDMIFKTLRRPDKLKTLLFLGDFGPNLQQLPRDLFHEFLAALDLSGTRIKELPSSARRMILLRYLDLSWTFIELLPEWISCFQELQTLRLKGCSGLRRLPNSMERLIKLRHLDLDVLGQLAPFPKGMGALINLRTLSAFAVGTVEGLKITELEKLNYLTGQFCIAKLENVWSVNEAEKASLTAKTNIKKLELRWSDCECEELKNDDEFILESLRPHSNLEEIQIVCYRGPNLPSWISDVSFKKLVSITLFRCEHVSIFPSLEKLPALEGLELTSLNSVTKMDCTGKRSRDHVAFPRLLKLAVDEMLNLQTWTEAQEADYPCLVELSIKDCPELLDLPSFIYLPSIKRLKLSGCASLAFVSDKHLSSSLQQLIVEDCPLIEERCSKEGGEDWHKIQLVPTIWIDQVAVQTYKDGSKAHIEDDKLLERTLKKKQRGE